MYISLLKARKTAIKHSSLFFKLYFPMPLRDQPYLPLYVQDFLMDEKLIECSAEATGVYIRLMCIMHKSAEYGTFLLKQKDKQTSSKVENFALKLTRFLPYSKDVILRALTELTQENVLTIDGDLLFQKRMVKDGQLSVTRSICGRKGGKSTTSKKTINKKIDQAKTQANTKSEYEYENESKYIKEKGGVGEKTIGKIPFEFVWQLYAKKVGDQANLATLWSSISDSDKQLIVEHIPKYLASEPNPRYRKNFENYLNQKTWLDEILPSRNDTSTETSTDSRTEATSGVCTGSQEPATTNYDESKF